MPLRARASHSLRARLLGSLFGAITLAAAIQAATAYNTALSEADIIFDRHMQKMALSLSSGAPLVNAEPNHDYSTDKDNEDFVVQLWTAQGAPLFQSAAHRNLRKPAQAGFSYVQTMDDRNYRVFSVITPAKVIQVAQDMAARHDMAATLAVRTVGPSVLMAMVLMLVVWWVIGRSLAPVARIRLQMAARKADDLSPLVEEGLPEEVLPLIHELNLLFERVRQAFEAQKNFVADAAHELRSPLAALKIQVQGLQRAGDEGTRDVGTRRLVAGIDRAARVVDQLLVLARQEAHATAHLERAPVDLGSIAVLAINDALLAANNRQIDLGVHRADTAVLPGDAEALRTMVRNLLDNAIQYAPAGASVDIEVCATPGAVTLSVEDSGPGIPASDRQRVLDRFYRLQGTGPQGSGLGLAIVKAIADRHNASVLIDTSPRLGGLRVQVCFHTAPRQAA